MSTLFSALLTQMLAQLPLLVAALMGVILPLVFWRRGAVPAVCVLLASLLIACVTVGQAAATQAFVQARIEHGWSAERYGQILGFLALGCSFLRALAWGLLLVAAFVRRGHPAAG